MTTAPTTTGRPRLVGREYHAASVWLRAVHVGIAYAAFLVVTVFVGAILTIGAAIAAMVHGRAEFDPMAAAVDPTFDTALTVAGWFCGMLGGLLAYRLLTRGYALVGRPTRCGACGSVLKGLREPKCPACGVPL